MSEHLRNAARKRHESATERAHDALSALAARGAPINFVRVAREAGVSTDFLYRQPQLRRRIEQLRTSSFIRNQPETSVEDLSSTSAAVRALSAQIKELRRSHRAEVTRLKQALAVAQGENLALRRRLACYE
ncbi:DUF6262 family protein [Mycolicibacterium gadium]|uniref:DUF6262 family protein n=1 Tax=Mycolicibacterium gadium TaxID=1794 RepID=A0ABT6GUK3_MYCGU|nr:DUF6262 family protein [Mycolicibacterium gadium]MDG5485498.1 DUF6262 family protein [Mycolicibacterium gadium]